MIASQDSSKQLRRGVVEPCILGLLAREPMYGWQLAEELTSGGQIIASIGTLYPVLTRLREQKLVTTFEQPSESGPSRKYYRLTAKGVKELEQFREIWQQFTADVSTIITIPEDKEKQ